MEVQFTLQSLQVLIMLVETNGLPSHVNGAFLLSSDGTSIKNSRKLSADKRESVGEKAKGETN